MRSFLLSDGSVTHCRLPGLRTQTSGALRRTFRPRAPHPPPPPVSDERKYARAPLARTPPSLGASGGGEKCADFSGGAARAYRGMAVRWEFFFGGGGGWRGGVHSALLRYGVCVRVCVRVCVDGTMCVCVCVCVCVQELQPFTNAPRARALLSNAHINTLSFTRAPQNRTHTSWQRVALPVTHTHTHTHARTHTHAHTHTHYSAVSGLFKAWLQKNQHFKEKNSANSNNPTDVQPLVINWWKRGG